MEMRLDKSYLKNIHSNALSNQIINDFEDKFVSDVRLINQYLEHSYLDKYSRFFLLVKIRESFYKSHRNTLNKFDSNIKSIFYLLIQLHGIHKWRESFEFEVNNIEDFIVYINIVLDLLLFEHTEQLIATTGLSKYLYNPKSSEIYLLENENLLSVLPYLFTPSTFKKVLQNELKIIDKNVEGGYNIGTDLFIITNRLNTLSNEIANRSLLNYVRNYNSINYELIITDRFHQKKNYYYQYTNEIDNFRYFLLNTDFRLDSSTEFESEFLREIDLKEYFIHLTVLESLSSESEQKVKRDFVDNLIIQKSFKNKLKIEVDGKFALKIFECFLLHYIGESRTKSLLPKFNSLIKYLQNEGEQNKPIITDFKVKELKYLLGFMNKYKKSDKNTKGYFTYKVNDLIDLFVEIFDFNEMEISRNSLDKAHRDSKFKPNSDLIKTVNSLL